MTRRDWWFGIVCLLLGLLAHATLPRYEWRNIGNLFFRIDQWTGTVDQGSWDGGQWTATRTRRARTEALERTIQELGGTVEPAPRPTP